MTWSSGHYELMAQQIAPVATAVVDVLAPAAGEIVVDLGCGTGNGALLAAGRGASVIGVDPASRLLGVARERASAAGLEIDFRDGDAASIPLDAGSVDAVMSVFGVIFARDAPAAAAEIARVLSPGGRLVMSAWLRDNALAAQSRLRSEVVATASGTPAGAPLFAWHDIDALAELFAPYGLEVSLQPGMLALVGESPAAFAQDELDNHPLWVQAREALEPAGAWADVPPRLTKLFTDANEDPTAFRITSRYVIATVRGK
jgi:SAM-dependent methyltransferase